MTSVACAPPSGKHLRVTPPPSIVPSAGPRWLSTIPENIPHELTADASWYPAIVRAKAGAVGSWDKLPGDPKTGQPATWSDPATRCTFDTAYMAYQSGAFGGIGYVLHGTGLLGIDLDRCIGEDGTVAVWAQSIVDDFSDGYWERSISGRGLRGFCRGTLPDGARAAKSKIEGCSVEIYTDARFLVVTGQTLRHVERLPTLQEPATALYTRLSRGRGRATGTATATGLRGPIGTPSPEAYALIVTMLGGRHGQALAPMWERTDPHARRVSEQDWACELELSYQAVRQGHDDATAARLIEEAMRAGPYRMRWDEARNGVTWLGQDVANALATTRARLGATPKLPADDPPDDDPGPPAPPAERPPCPGGCCAHADENAALRRENAALRRRFETIQRARQQEREQYQRDRRFMLADRNLRRSKLSSLQVDAYVEVARVGATRAAQFDTSRVIVVAQKIAETLGATPRAVGSALDAVCALPGSPMTRETLPTEDRQRRVTWYTLASADPIDLLEGLVTATATLEARPTRPAGRGSRPRPKPPVPSPCCPGEKLIDLEQYMCSGCGRVHAMSEPPALYVEKRPIAPDTAAAAAASPTVSGVYVEKRHIATPVELLLSTVLAEPTIEAEPAEDVMPDAGSGVASADTVRRLPLVERRDVWICPASGCGSMERHVFPDGSWRCRSRGHRSIDHEAPPADLTGDAS